MLETIVHKTCHFLYFKKWKEVFPDAQGKTFNYPYLEWHLSEILVPVILSDKRINKFFKNKSIFYEEHKGIKIDNNSVLVYFSKLYRDHLEGKSSFSDFLKAAYSVIKENEGLFKF